MDATLYTPRPPAKAGASVRILRFAYLLGGTEGDDPYAEREVCELGRLGHQVFPVSLDAAPDPLATGQEQVHRSNKVHVRRLGLGKSGFAAVIRLLQQHPWNGWRAFGVAWRSARTGQACGHHLLAACKAFLLVQFMRQNQLEHLHVRISEQTADLVPVLANLGIAHSLHISQSGVIASLPAAYWHSLPESCRFVLASSRHVRGQMWWQAGQQAFECSDVCLAGIDLLRFDWQPPPGRKDVFRLVAIAGLQPVHGHGLLLQAVAGLVREGRCVSLTIVGSGPELPDLQAEACRLGISERVVWHPEATLAERYYQLRQADAYVHGCLGEQVPCTLLEAMAMGVPCIATRVASVPELVREGIDGLLVTPGEVKALSLSIIRLLDSPELSLAISCTARRRVEERHELGQTVAGLTQIMEKNMT